MTFMGSELSIWGYGWGRGSSCCAGAGARAMFLLIYAAAMLRSPNATPVTMLGGSVPPLRSWFGSLPSHQPSV